MMTTECKEVEIELIKKVLPDECVGCFWLSARKPEGGVWFSVCDMPFNRCMTIVFRLKNERPEGKKSCWEKLE